MSTNNTAVAAIASTKNNTAKKTATKKAAKKTTLTERIAKVAKKTAVKKTTAKTAVKKTTAKTAPDTVIFRTPQVISLKKMPKEDEKIAAQAKAILDVLKQHKGSMLSDKLVEALAAKLDTVQSPKRIFVFYRPTLVENGYITVKEAK